eukprot:TRINITY_DN34075_c0_g1_i10.p1 TRINITY_DN34075_c0_g1~~TRINITY_DN34075_c0_g1_i10.p1  ORF type:complete len:196 (-),score=6.95 TRINITY_DN34075_c0_g1_i10:21-608(-)
MQHFHMDWNPKQFKILGVWFTNDLVDCTEINIQAAFAEIQTLYKIWLKRQITPLGRVAVLKSLILSKLIHLWILLPNPPDTVIDAIQKSVFLFVWDKKRDKINRTTAVRNILNGGLGVPKIKEYITALKLTWIRKLATCSHKWKSIILAVCPRIKDLQRVGFNFPCGNLSYNHFWSDVFDAYTKMGRKIIPCTLR